MRAINLPSRQHRAVQTECWGGICINACARGLILCSPGRSADDGPPLI
jgi:hypothetical protein